MRAVAFHSTRIQCKVGGHVEFGEVVDGVDQIPGEFKRLVPRQMAHPRKRYGQGFIDSPGIADTE